MPYSSTKENLIDELRWVSHLITAHVLRLRHVNFYEGLKDFREFFISDKEIDALLASNIFERNEQIDIERKKKIIDLLGNAEKLRKEINKSAEESIANNIFLPISQVAKCFRLSEFELKTLMICLAPQLDTRYEKLYAYLQNDGTKRHPTIDLIFSLMDLSFEERISARDYFAAQAPLFKFRILEFLENEYAKNIPLLSKHLKVNDRIAGYLLDSGFIDNEFKQIAELYYPEQELSSLILPETVKEHLIKFITWYKNESSEKKQNIIFFFYGSYGAGKQEAAGTLCREIGLPLLIIDLEAIQNFELPLKHILELAFRESLLLPAALYFKNTGAIFNEKSHYQSEIFLKTVNENSWFSFISSSHSIDIQGQLAFQRFIQVEFTIPDYTQRQQLWQFYLNGQHSTSKEVDLDAVASKFNFTKGQIQDAIAAASNRVCFRSPEHGQITMQDIYEGCRAQSNQKLKTLSQKIKPKYLWQDIVLPKDQMAQLREITNYVKYKHLVYGDWGFDRKLSLGKGLNVLFSGPSGTGKTMVAEIMSNELHLDLYKIDLSTVVSKYIGETEKNLSKIFKEAETSNAILFFDEADALFGKRSEVKDAHDRYANIEIGYLLQKMDEYVGTVILATNLRKNVDDAFIRRMHFIVEFPFPAENYRLLIWQKIFPKETPRSDNIDYNFLARKFNMSGGNIKNITLAAAFCAADDGGIVNMKHLIQATKREFQKIGKLCEKTDFGKHFELLQS
jgi:ATP-dependent 26S proteasome regulatory subunit